MATINCRCQSCDLKGCCDFYQHAIKPVLGVVETDCFDMYDHTSVAYLNALTEILNDFSCDQYE